MLQRRGAGVNFVEKNQYITAAYKKNTTLKNSVKKHICVKNATTFEYNSVKNTCQKTPKINLSKAS